MVSATGAVLWRGHGAFDNDAAASLGAALDLAAGVGDDTPAVAPPERVRQFDFAFDGRTQPLLALIGVVPSTAHGTLDGARLVARFGPHLRLLDLASAEVDLGDEAVGRRMST